MKKKQVRGGNSGFYKDGQTHGHDSNSCPRRVLLRHHGVEPPVDDVRTQKTFNIGFLNEELFVKHYMPQIPHCIDFEIEEPITDTVDFVGHADVVTDSLVFELKSATSRNTWQQVSSGKPKLSHLAQCCNYMLSREVTRGYLVYSLYAYVQGLELPDKFFQIDIDNDGNILLDNKQTGYNLEHVVADRQNKARVLEDNIVEEGRPVNPTDSKSPCFYCPFKDICDKWDKASKNKTTEKFVAKAKEVCYAIEVEQNLNRQERLRKAAENFGTKVPR